MQSKFNINKRLGFGILGNLLSRASTLMAPFFVMPEMLRYMGEQNFGIWLTAISITSIAQFLDFGIGNGLLTRLSKAIAEKNYRSVRAYIASAYGALGAIALVLISIISVVFWAYLKLQKHGDAEIENSAQAQIIATCAYVFCIGVPISVIQRVLYASQNFLEVNIWQIIGSAISIASCIAAIQLKLSPWMVVGLYSISPVLTMTTATWSFFARNVKFRLSIKDFSIGTSKDLLRLGSGFFLLSILTSIALNADNILILEKLGSNAVTEYAVPAKLASLLGLIVTTLFLPLWSANGAAFAKGDFVWVKKTAIAMSFLGGLIVAIAACVLIFYSEFITKLWMSRTFNGQFSTVLFLSFLSFVMAVTSPFNMILNSLGRLSPQITAWIAFVVLSIPTKYFFVEQNRMWVIPLIAAVGYLSLITVPIIVDTFINTPISNSSRAKRA